MREDKPIVRNKSLYHLREIDEIRHESGRVKAGKNNILCEKANLEKKYKKLKILTKAEFEEMFA